MTRASCNVAILCVAVSAALLLGVMVMNTLRIRPRYAHDRAESLVDAHTQQYTLSPDDLGDVAQRLSQAIAKRTVSLDHGHQGRHVSSKWEWDQFDAFDDFLRTSYPLVFSRMRPIHVPTMTCNHSIIMKWEGTSPHLDPILLMGHLDVVPVEDGTLEDWSYDPFDGLIAEGYVWGRGAIDDKGSLMATFEALELLLRRGFAPTRSVYVAVGHDEEVGGVSGAALIAGHLARQGTEMALVMDEGGYVMRSGFVAGLCRDVALVGIAEKGYMSLELAVDAAGGHSSMPPRETAIGVLSTALSALEASPMGASIDERTTGLMLDHVAPYVPWAQRFFLANRWAFSRILAMVLERSPSMNALLRTTTAITMVHAGQKDNVLPQRATAVVNFRLKPGDTREATIAHVKSAIMDSRVSISPRGAMSKEASEISSTHSFGWNVLTKTIQQRFPHAVIAPYVVVGATDARYMHSISKSVYRFTGLRLAKEDIKTIHGTNERVKLADYYDAVNFYAQLVVNSQSMGDEDQHHRQEL